MKMICVKRLNVIGGKVSNLTPGKQYDVSPIPIPLNDDDDILRIPDEPKVMVWSDDINSDYLYPMSAFLTIEEWRQKQLDELGI